MIEPVFSELPKFKENKKIQQNSKLWRSLLTAVNKQKDHINKSLVQRKPSQTPAEANAQKKMSSNLKSFRVVNMSRQKKQANICASMIDNHYKINNNPNRSSLNSEISVRNSRRGVSAKSYSPQASKILNRSGEDPFRTCITTFYQSKFDEKGKIQFKGDVSKNTGKKDGKGTEFYINGNKKYEGKFKNDMCHGKGKFYSIIGTFLYEGFFKKGKFCGLGKSFYPTGIVKHQGEYADGYYNGQGNLYNNDGHLIYQGNLKNHSRHGQGIEYYDREGTFKRFEGKWKFDKKHGFGTEWDTEGNVFYEGNYAKGKYFGEGKRFYICGALMYEGGFKKNHRNDFGKAYYEEGALMYEGLWESNFFNGKGTTYYESGKKKYTGNFVEGNQDGFGEEYHYENGNLKYRGMFLNNKEFLKGTYYTYEGLPVHQFDYSDDTVCQKTIANTIALVKNIHMDIPKNKP